MPSDALESDTASDQRQRSLLLFVILFGAAFLFSTLYREQIVDFGNTLLEHFSAGGLYVVLFVLAAVSSTLVPLPVWIYVFTSVALGFDCMVCALVIALGSAVGSVSSYVLGRWFRQSRPLQRMLDESTLQKWQVRSRNYCTAVLFLGTASPVPMDAVYAASGVLRFPALRFVTLVTAARVIRYEMMAYVFFVLQ